MRRKDRLVEEREILDAIIQRTDVLRIAMSVNNQPYIVPVNFGYVEGVFYFHCANEGKKLEMIKENPNVCFELDVDHELVCGEKACHFTMHYKSIIGYGKAEICLETTDKIIGLNAVMAHFSDEIFSYEMGEINRVTVVKIVVDEMVGKISGKKP